MIIEAIDYLNCLQMNGLIEAGLVLQDPSTGVDPLGSRAETQTNFEFSTKVPGHFSSLMKILRKCYLVFNKDTVFD